ncbi:MAG: hypothetical protein V4559_08870 [Pseudomonadota bacterium]
MSARTDSESAQSGLPRRLKIEMNDIGRLDNYCPYCGIELKKRPVRRTACKHCLHDIFVRTRPLDKMRVLLTEQEAKIVEGQWARFKHVTIRVFVDQAEFEKQRASLTKSLGRAPTSSEITWPALAQEAAAHAAKRNWGLYRNTHLSMAAFLEEEGKRDEAFDQYLEVCVVDLNGPRNTGGYSVPEYPDFSPNLAFLAPAVISKVGELILLLKLDEHELRDRFFGIAERLGEKLSLPFSLVAGWTTLSSEFYVD